MTTDIPMLRDGTVYEVYIIRKNGDCSKNEIKAIEKLCNVNYINFFEFILTSIDHTKYFLTIFIIFSFFVLSAISKTLQFLTYSFE